MLFMIIAPLAGLVFRWNWSALLWAVSIGVIGDIALLGPAALKTLPVLDGPIGVVGFVATSMLASAVAAVRAR